MNTSVEDHSPQPGLALAVLHVEDSAQDVTLLRKQLERAGYSPSVDIVSEPEEFLSALHSKPYDIVLADYNLPKWSGADALRLLRQENNEIPFILVTGTVGEETAVECIKMGATDYVLKDHLGRLSQAVRRALQERITRGERRQAEQNRDRLAAIVESSEDAIISMTLDGAIVSWNTGAARIYGYSAEEIRGKAFSQLFAPNSFHELEAALERLRSGQSTERYRTAGTTRSGSAIHVALTTSPIREPDGAISGGSAIIRDITQHCFLEEQLRHSQKMDAIGRLAGGVAHDFNNLLTVILGYASLLQKRVEPDSPLHKTVGEIRRAAQQAALLTGQLLAFSRKQFSEPRDMDLNVLVEEMQGMLERLIGEDIDLVVLKSGCLPPVKADTGQISQVIMNLLANARDSMPMGGKIVIETGEVLKHQQDVGNLGIHPAGRYVTISVTDNGSGMDVETQSHIFEPFFTTKDPGKGTGLGLATVYGIVQQHGGWIDVSSTLDKGTTFKIYMPATSERVVDVIPAHTGSPELAKRRGTILLVEDQAPVRILAEEVLLEGGHQVLAAANGVAALELANRHTESIDLLITDVIMPKLSGPELASQLRRSRPGLIVLYMSGYSDQTLLLRRTTEEVTAFLPKPFSPEDLLAEADRLLHRGTCHPNR
jgi:two-component system cell cycle sensor histidine kinase/response regulator CckA